MLTIAFSSFEFILQVMSISVGEVSVGKLVLMTEVHGVIVVCCFVTQQL